MLPIIIKYVWLFSILFVILVSFASAVLSLTLGGRKRLIAIDALLWSATLVIVLAAGGEFCLPKADREQSSEPFKLPYIRRADLQASGLTSALCVSRLPEPFLSLVKIDGGHSIESELESQKEFLQKLANAHPDDPAVAVRLAIVVSKMGGEPMSVLDAYLPGGKKKSESKEKEQNQDELKANSLLALLAELYSKKELQMKCDDAQAIVNNGLPEGWFREEALLAVYSSLKSPSFNTLRAEREALIRSWHQRYELVKSAQFLFAILGVFGLAYFWGKGKSKEPFNVPYNFRQLYGCLLAVLYSGFLAIFFAAMFVAAYAAATNSKPGNISLYAQFLMVITGLLSTFISVKYVICKPLGLSFWRDFIAGPHEMKVRQIVQNAAIGFCCMMTVGSVLQYAARFLLRAPSGIGNEAFIQAIDSILSPNLVLVWFVAIICFVAPIMEELLFRRLLYPWLRIRTNVPVAIIASALIFALWHGDMVGFWQYLSFGLVLAYVFENVRNLATVILIHGLWNTWAMVGAYLLIPK